MYCLSDTYTRYSPCWLALCAVELRSSSDQFLHFIIEIKVWEHRPTEWFHHDLIVQSYEGDIEEAITFLKMTSLTATPSQLGRLGLISKKSAKALEAPSYTTATASNLGSGSGDEVFQSKIPVARVLDGNHLLKPQICLVNAAYTCIKSRKAVFHLDWQSDVIYILHDPVH